MSQGWIAVVMGGFSSEREVSLRSGAAVLSALQRCGYSARAVDFRSAEELLAVLQSSEYAAVFVALHGRFGEDGTVQSLLEQLQIPYTGSGARASRLAFDKVGSRQLFAQAGLRVPRYRLLEPADGHDRLQMLPVPVVVKPCREGSSFGLSVVHDVLAFGNAVADAFRYDDRVLVEEYIAGTEVTVGIVGDQALPLVEVRPRSGCYDYYAKYTPGMTEYIVPAAVSAEISARAQSAGKTAHQVLGCRGFSRVDMIISAEGDPVVLEVNTIPGMTETSLLPKAAQAAGMSFDHLCERMVQSAWEAPVVPSRPEVAAALRRR